jgi:hypothetical protein
VPPPQGEQGELPEALLLPGEHHAFRNHVTLLLPAEEVATASVRPSPSTAGGKEGRGGGGQELGGTRSCKCRPSLALGKDLLRLYEAGAKQLRAFKSVRSLVGEGGGGLYIIHTPPHPPL